MKISHDLRIYDYERNFTGGIIKMSRINRYRIQFVATVLGCISIVKMMWDAFRWSDITMLMSLEFIYCMMLVVGSGVIAFSYKSNNKYMLVKAHIILLAGFITRFCDVAVQCLFSGDVPVYSIILFDLLPAFSIVSEIAVLVILMKNKKSEIWKKIVLTNSLIQSVFWGLVVLYGGANAFTSEYAMTEALSGLYIVVLFITNINIGIDCIKNEI